MKARETNNGKKGGLLKGKSHEKGGIKVVVTDTNQRVEVEGGEAIITKPAVEKNWRILSKINQEAGGVPILPPSEAINDSEMKVGGELAKGIKIEREHEKTAEKLYKHKITPKQSPKSIAKEHLKENKHYYSKLLEMEKDFAKGGALEPHKEVSASIQASIKDVLTLPQFNDLKPMEAGMLYSLLSDYKDFEKNEEGMPTQVVHLSEMQEPIFESLFKKEYLIDDTQYSQYRKYIITLTERATEFIDAVTTRLQTRRAVKQGTDLFPDESAIPELVSVEYPEEAVSKSKSNKLVKYSAREISDIDSIDLMRNLALLKPELKDLMDEAIVVTEKLNAIREKSGNSAFDYEYHSDKPNASRKLFPFVHRMYMQFITSRKSTPEKKEKDIALFKKTIENAKKYLKNPPSDEELAQLKQAKEKSDTDKTEKTKQMLLSGQLQAQRIAEIQETEKEFIETTGGYPRQIASFLERGVSKEDILLTKKIAQAFDEVEGASDFGKVLAFMEKHDFNINALISKLTSVNYDDKEKRQKSIDLILKLEQIASGDADAVEQKKFSENYRPLLWHLTLKEFCEYAENYEVDTRLEGTKARLECEEFYKYAVVRPLLDDSAERNVFLLAVESGQLPYEKAVEIITSAGAWNESNKFVKELMNNNQLRNYNANIWLTPKALYLSSDYFKNNFTRAQAETHYRKNIYHLAILDDKHVHELLEKGVVTFKDIQARIDESGAITTNADQRYIDKLKAIADNFSAKLKMKGLYLLLDDELSIKKEFQTHKDMSKDIRTYTDAFQPDVERRIAQAKKENEQIEDNEVLKYATKNGLEIIKKAEKQGGVLVNRKRLIENATKISKLDWMGKLKKDKGLPLEAIAEALQYESGYNDNWKDLTNAIEKGGYELNKDTIERLKSIGIELPKETYKMFDSKMQHHKKEHERKKSLFPENERKFVDRLIKDTYANVKYNKVKLEKLAKEFGIKEQNLAKELAELSISFVARVYAHDTELSPKQRYEKIVKLYESQVNLSHRTSESIMFQQYSTPAPIGFVAGIYCGVNENSGGEYFEASAGNGLLTIAGNSKNWIVNEIDPIRNRNLNVLGFKQVLKQDATEPFKNFAKKFDAIITNPPFARIEGVEYGNVKLTSLEQLMSLRALETMKDDGKGAIIIGGHTEYDKEGRIQAGKNRIFFVYLYKHYNVEDVINISGRDLYSRQGTSFNTRLILINGRKKVPSGFPPIITEPIPMEKTNSYTPVNSFEVLWERVNKLL